jgi:hypothetical protein
VAISIDAWRRVVQPHFRFLEDAGFRCAPDLGDTGTWRTRVVYVADQRAVAVDYSVEFERVEVWLLRLADGQLPEPQVWVTDAPIAHVRLDNVLHARDPERYEAQRALTRLSDDALDSQLAAGAAALREVAADFVAGSLAAIDDAERVIRAQIQEHPQQLTIHLPDGATADEEREAIDRVRARVPPNVGIVAQRYRQRGR